MTDNKRSTTWAHWGVDIWDQEDEAWDHRHWFGTKIRALSFANAMENRGVITRIVYLGGQADSWID